MSDLTKDASLNTSYCQELEAQSVVNRGLWFAKFIRNNKKIIIDVLTTYEIYRVANDEISRTLDLLENLNENKEYFEKKIGTTVSFLPINQPLYALACFGIVPALMSKQVYVRPPAIAWGMINELVKVISLNTFFPNLFISNQTRNEFINQHKMRKGINRADVVIFTGKPENAYITQKAFGESVLFIGNGASHNPVVISRGADIDASVEAVLEVQLYNQGADCAAPNSILVESSVYNNFIKRLRIAVKGVKVGGYKDKETIVGPFLEKKHLKEVEALLMEYDRFIDHSTRPVLRREENIIAPIIINKPLVEGGNYVEWYAPVFIVQKYEKDSDLHLYFENPVYEKQAGYITLFGKSDYVEGLIGKKFYSGKILHPADTILRNTHLHAFGMERGVKPYGGYGENSSFVSWGGITLPKPTLPQREIYDYLVKNKF